MEVKTETLNSGAIVPLVVMISNPLSTTNAKNLDEIRKIVNASANVVHYELDGIDTLQDAIELFARAKPSLLIVNGGDGTIGAALAAILYNNPFNVVPPIAFLPGGKTNMTAADLGFKGNPSKVLKKLLKLTQAGEIPNKLTTRHLIEMDLGDGLPPRVGTFFGTAGIVRGIFWCRENAYSKGLPNWLAHVWSAYKLITAAFGLSRDKGLMISDPMAITVPGNARIKGRYSVVLTTTLDNLLFGLKPYGREGKGGLRFSAIEAGPSNFFRGFLGLITGRFGRKTINGVHVRRGDMVRIEGTDPVTLDGEIYQPLENTPITLKGDRSLTFVSLKK
ncbi:diacylglycerol/lipid kinase family protein [Kordiimonas aquimaris]|uniref:diacylglycerol/lipid kinase family protein n=1 Tax=Kordiimonas aquimaris TaxID=707591 RepID=UPI0021D02AF8|nr:diacylglycerol kinase family protein [Kordiimonas aquimaris]